VPWCPSCRDEFREGFTACADCGVDLLPALPADGEAAPEDPGEGWVAVAAASQAMAAELLALRLREEGIDARLLDPRLAGGEADEAPRWRLAVREGQEAAAREALAREVELPEDAEFAEADEEIGEER
jgi:hypothetical protein